MWGKQNRPAAEQEGEKEIRIQKAVRRREKADSGECHIEEEDVSAELDLHSSSQKISQGKKAPKRLEKRKTGEQVMQENWEKRPTKHLTGRVEASGCGDTSDKIIQTWSKHCFHVKG